MAITVADDALGRAVTFISAFCGHPLGQPAKGDRTSVTTSEGAVTGLAACATALAAAAPARSDLLGRDAAERAQVSEWLAHCATELALLLDDKLAGLSAALAPRTYLVGERLTLADLAAYATVQPAIAALPPAQVDQLCCLLRWADLVQHSADPREAVFPSRALPLPRFVPPPPPPAAAPPPAAGAAAAGGKGAGAAAAEASGKGSAASSATKAGGAAAGAGAAATSTASSSQAANGTASDKKTAKKKGKEVGAAAADGAAAAAPATAAAAGGGGKKAAAEGGDDVGIDALDICVGTIVNVGKHPNADALYLEEIDVGEDKPRQVISGLVRFVPLERMQGRRVVVVLNLKPAKMRDVMSYGMVLCASNDAHDAVDPIIPPEGVPNGERITVEGYGGAPLAEVNPKKKILERLLPDMRTDAAGVPTFRGAPFMTSKGAVASTIPNAHVG